MVRHLLEQDDSLLPVNEEPPSIVAMGTSPEESRQVYDQWAGHYERDIRKWGYTMPETVATLLSKHVNDIKNVTLLDAGAGDGLSGVALRNAGFQGHMLGIDISPNMLQVAEQRQCYDATRVVNLNEPLPFETNTFDVVTCVGTLTYVENPDNQASTLKEFVRVTKPGGWICYTNRTDKQGFVDEERRLEDEHHWEAVEKVGPLPYLPDNPDYGDTVQVNVFLYRVL